jgi:hypothetical protein
MADRRRGLAAVVAAVVATAGVALGDAARVSSEAGGGAADGLIWANVQFTTPPSSGSPDASGCRWRPAEMHDAGIGQSRDITRVVADVLQRLFERSCDGTTVTVWISQPRPAQLGAVARDVVIGRLPPPRPVTAPPPERAIVRSPVWFWTDPAVWRGVSVTAWVPTPDGVLWATTSAHPVRLVMSSGEDGVAAVSCRGPGRAWTPADGDEAWSACSVTYVHESSLAPAGRFPAVMGVDWAISWRSSDGQRGRLPGHRTTAPVPMRVSEIQALVTAAGR